MVTGIVFCLVGRQTLAGELSKPEELEREANCEDFAFFENCRPEQWTKLKLKNKKLVKTQMRRMRLSVKQTPDSNSTPKMLLQAVSDEEINETVYTTLATTSQKTVMPNEN